MFLITIKRSGDGFALHHTELEEHTQHVMLLADQHAFTGADHFDLEKVMKVP